MGCCEPGEGEGGFELGRWRLWWVFVGLVISDRKWVQVFVVGHLSCGGSVGGMSSGLGR